MLLKHHESLLQHKKEITATCKQLDLLLAGLLVGNPWPPRGAGRLLVELLASNPWQRGGAGRRFGCGGARGYPPAGADLPRPQQGEAVELLQDADPVALLRSELMWPPTHGAMQGRRNSGCGASRVAGAPGEAAGGGGFGERVDAGKTESNESHPWREMGVGKMDG